MPGKKKSNEALLAFSSPTLTPAQEKFVRKHMKGGGFFDKHAKVRADLETLHDSVVLKLEQVETGLAELRPLVTNKAQAEMVGDLQMRRGSIVGGIGIKAKSLKDAVDKLDTADKALDALVKSVAETRGKFTTVDGSELDDREAIRKLRVATEGKLRDYLHSWETGYNRVLAEVNKVSPGTLPNIPPEARLLPKFKALFEKLPGTPKDMGAGIEQAQREFDALVAAMSKEHETARAALDRYVSESLENELKVIRLYDALGRALEGYDDVAPSLARWGVDGEKALADRAKTLRARIEDFGDGKVPMDQIKDTYAALSGEARTLVRDAQKLIGGAYSAFNSEQGALKEEHAKLKKRLDALDKRTLPDEQRGPIDTFLSATDTSITRLGGANASALKAARQMLAEAERQVSQAENITSINNEIRSNIDIAHRMLKPLLGDKAPVNESANEHEAAVAKFETEWVKQAPDEALKTSGELKKRAEDLKVQNALLVQNRAAADVEIEKLERKYEAFNDLFKELLAAKNAPKVRDYRGPVRGEIDGVKTWNTTKMDPAFHSTIMARLDTLSREMDERTTVMRASLNSSGEELAARAVGAKDLLEQAKSGGSSEEDIARLQAAHDQAVAAKMVYIDLSQDLLAAEAQEQKYIDDREKFLADAGTWIKDTQKAVSSAAATEPFNRYKDEVERQIIRLEATVKAARTDKTGPTGTRGLAELKEVKAAVQRIADRGEMIPPTKLGGIGDNWSDAVSDFLDKSGQIVVAIADFEKQMGVDDKASRAIEGVLFDVYGRIAPTRFSEAGAILGPSTPPKSAQERKAGREIALSEVRRIKKAMMDDAVVKACLANPFGIGGLTTKAIARLEQIELDVLRGA